MSIVRSRLSIVIELRVLNRTVRTVFFRPGVTVVRVHGTHAHKQPNATIKCNSTSKVFSEFRSCVKVEAAVLGFPS